MQEEAQMFEWAGISFGEEETYRLQKSIKKLAVMSKARQLRFWGKIYGVEKDYYIVEGELQHEEEAPTDST